MTAYALSPEEMALRLIIAALCGLILGIDRELKHKTVGLRSYMLVAVGAAGFTLATIEMSTMAVVTGQATSIDISRVVQGVVTGIGFMGAGAVIQSGDKVMGTATGAGIWVTGAVGIASGLGAYWLVALITIITFLILSVLGILRAKMRDDLEDDQGDVSGK